MTSETKVLLSEEEFWTLINAGREQSEDDEALAEQVAQIVSKLEPEKIFGFDQILGELMAKSYRSDLWCTAYVACGGCSDDGFDYFRAWLIGRGKDVFYKALENPDSLIAEFDKLKGEDGYPENEMVLGIASDAYEANTGKDDFYEKCPHTPAPTPEMDFEWSEEDEESMKKICPKVFEKYWQDSF